MVYDLPTSIEVCGTSYEIRSDYRAVLDICIALSDAELDEQERALVLLTVFYPQLRTMPQEHYQEAVKQCCDFINGPGGYEGAGQRAKVLDWEQDFSMIVSDVNRVAGCEVRSLPFCHWWTFLSWFNGIGEGQLSTVVSIREKLRKGKKLSDWEREFYRGNRNKVDFKTKYTTAEEDLLAVFGAK